MYLVAKSDSMSIWTLTDVNVFSLSVNCTGDLASWVRERGREGGGDGETGREGRKAGGERGRRRVEKVKEGGGGGRKRTVKGIKGALVSGVLYTHVNLSIQ